MLEAYRGTFETFWNLVGLKSALAEDLLYQMACLLRSARGEEADVLIETIQSACTHVPRCGARVLALLDIASGYRLFEGDRWPAREGDWSLGDAMLNWGGTAYAFLDSQGRGRGFLNYAKSDDRDNELIWPADPFKAGRLAAWFARNAKLDPDEYHPVCARQVVREL
ncbi:MAG: hypothetical protein ISS78_10585, partial [Phycisphaerae bacterium]|nr:hypothetical protein [Phycisphaerae bacterium]